MSALWPWRRSRADRRELDWYGSDDHEVAVDDLLLSSDHPIGTGEEDRLERRSFAEVVAAEIVAAPRVGGFVTAVTGSWGSGKTSVINMAVEHLQARGAATPVVFNPWLFAGPEQLVEHFFRELGTQLEEAGEESLARIGKQLVVYGGLAGPVVRRADRSLQSQRMQLFAELRRLRRPVLVVVDDLDRLKASEVRDVARLVRLVGDLPNVVYLLGYDRARVEHALGEREGADRAAEGRAYLEKIVQVSHEVPPPAPELLTKLTEEAVSRAVGDVSGLTLDPEAFLDVFRSGIRPMIDTVRDIRRYANLLASRVRLLGDQVELADILALEAIRVFAPDSHRLIVSSREALTTPASLAGDGGGERAAATERAQVHAILDAAGDRREAVEELIRRAFPIVVRHLGGGAAVGPGWLPTWRRTRRVAHPEILDIYLTRTLPAGTISAREADAVFESLEAPDELEQRLERLDEDQLEVMLERLEHHDADPPGERPEVPIVVLTNQLERLRKAGPQRRDPGAETRLPGVVLRILRALDAPRAERAVRAALPKLVSLSARMELIDLVGHHPGVGYGLVDQEAAIQLEAEHVLQVLSADVQALSGERRLTPLIERACQWDRAVGHGLAVQVAQDDQRLLALLRGATRRSGERLGGAVGSEREAVTYELDWQRLAALLGEDALVERVRVLHKSVDVQSDARTRAAVAQARRHAMDSARAGEAANGAGAKNGVSEEAG